MPVYSLEKWYFDFDSGDGTIFGYLANVHLFGTDTCLLSVTDVGSSAGKPRTMSRRLELASCDNAGCATTSHGIIEVASGRGRLSLDADGLSIDLEIEIDDAGAMPLLHIDTPRSKGLIAWRPLALRARATGTVTLHNQTTRVVHAHAYLDYVHSTLFPRLAPAKTLLWGRLHHDELALTYTVLEGPTPNERWSLMVVSEPGRVTAMPIVRRAVARSESQRDPLPAAYELTGTTDGITVAVQIEPTKLAILTPFTDDASLGRLGQRLFAWLAQHPVALKHFARAHIQLNQGGRIREFRNVPTFGESVTFAR